MTQQNPNPQADEVGRVATKNKRDRPFQIFARYREDSWGYRVFCRKGNPWRNYKPKGYRTAEERDNALEALQRKYSNFMEFRRGDEPG